MRDLERRLLDADPAAGTTDELDQRARTDLAAVLATPRQAAPLTGAAARTTRRPSRRVMALAAGLIVIAGTGAFIAQQVAEPPPTVSATSSAPDADTLLDAFDTAPAAAAKIYASTTELAADSDLVATGRFVRFQPGRTDVRVSDGRELEGTSTVMVLDQTTIEKGQAATGSEGFLYLEVAIGAEDSMPQEAADAIPAGTQVLVYANAAWDGTTTVDGYRAKDPSAGRPAGQPLYGLYKPQSLTLQAAGDVVVWPALRRAQPGVLADALPGGDLIWTP